MTHSPSALQDDLAYVRDLAEAGQKAPLIGGRFYAWWGGLSTAAYVGHYSIASGAVAGGGNALNYMWGAYFVVGMAGFIALMLTFPKAKPGMYSTANQASQIVWKAGGLAMFAFFAGVIARSFADGEASIGFAWSVPLVLTVYAIGQITTGQMAGSKPLEFGGWVALAGVAASAFFTQSNVIWLVGAAVAFLAVFMPGVMLMLREPKEVV